MAPPPPSAQVGTDIYYPPPQDFYPPFAISFRQRTAPVVEYMFVFIELLFYPWAGALDNLRDDDADPGGGETARGREGAGPDRQRAAAALPLFERAA